MHLGADYLAGHCETLAFLTTKEALELYDKGVVGGRKETDNLSNKAQLSVYKKLTNKSTPLKKRIIYLTNNLFKTKSLGGGHFWKSLLSKSVQNTSFTNKLTIENECHWVC
jgi:hypothetical protein